MVPDGPGWPGVKPRMAHGGWSRMARDGLGWSGMAQYGLEGTGGVFGGTFLDDGRDTSAHAPSELPRLRTGIATAKGGGFV